MTETANPDDPENDVRDGAPTPADDAKAPLPTWKKALMIGAGLLVLAGLALLPFQSSGDLSTSQGGGVSGQSFDGTGNSFTSGGSPNEVGADQNQDLAPTFLKLGFSFFVGFAIGYAFRAFLKIALIIVGIQLIALFGLSAVDWVEVRWDVMASAWDGFAANVGTQFESIRAFITGSLPQATLAGLGLFAGFKRN